MKKIIATIFAAICSGVLLGMLLLSFYSNTEAQTGLPKVVQASELIQNDENSNKHMEQNILEVNLSLQNNKWYFVQAGVFNDIGSAGPIIYNIEKYGIRPQVISNNPSRLMVASFTNFHNANNIAKQLETMNIELYVKEMNINQQTPTINISKQDKQLVKELETKLDIYAKLLANHSYLLLSGEDNNNTVDTEILRNIVYELNELTTIILERTNALNKDSYDFSSNVFLQDLKKQINQTKIIIDDNKVSNAYSPDNQKAIKKLGWLLQEQLLVYLATCN